MKRKTGTTVRGIRGPIIRENDDLGKIVVTSVMDAAESEGFSLNDRDVVAITESIVARSQGNYVTIDHIADDIRQKINGAALGVIFPILSRNRFAVCLRGIARGCKKIILMLSYPRDEVGNELVSLDAIEEAGINPYVDNLSLAEYRRLFGANKHHFTGVDYVEYYISLIEAEGCEAEVVFANHACEILQYTDTVLTCDIHTRIRSKKALINAGAKLVFGLEDILNKPSDEHGYNTRYGLLGSNKATEDSVKLFPRDCQHLVENIQQLLFEKTQKNIEVMVYGDGAFRDPQGMIWELADPCVSPCYTIGLEGTPHELKLKYLADTEFKDLSGEELKLTIHERIANKNDDAVGAMALQGTTPRRLTDLIGSLCDLTSGSGDKGTPIVLVQGYFDSYIQ